MKLRNRRIATIEIKPQSIALLEDWLCHRAKRDKVFENLGIGRASVFRYIKRIQNKESSITQLFTFEQIKQLIEMYNEEFEESQKPKEEKNKYESVEKQKQILEKTIKEQNWDYSSNGFAKNYKKQFDELVEGYNSPDERIHQEAILKMKELNKDERTALLKYNNYLAIKRRKL